MESVDLLIIGAGPAGLSTGLHLLQADPAWAGRMLLLEKAAHPRPKLCGGGVTRLGLTILRDLGLPLPLPIPQTRVDDVRLGYAGRVIHTRGRPHFAVFHRQELDAYLAEQARRGGAVICENEAVTAFQVDEEGVTVNTSRSAYHAKAIVAADGSKGIVRQTLMRQESTQPLQTPRRQRVARLLETLCTADAASPLFLEQAAEFDFTPADDGLQGYCWDFPSWVEGERHINRGIYDARVAVSRKRPNLRGLLNAYLEKRIAVTERPTIEGHPIHWFSPRQRFAWPRLLLTGDAAGVDPLFGEGIGPALGYGQVAAHSLQAAFASGDFSFQDYRQRLKESTVGRYLMVRWVAAEGAYRLSHRRAFMHLVWTLGDVAARLWPKLPALY